MPGDLSWDEWFLGREPISHDESWENLLGESNPNDMKGLGRLTFSEL